MAEKQTNGKDYRITINYFFKSKYLCFFLLIKIVIRKKDCILVYILNF
jgi:hypothetical protein